MNSRRSSAAAALPGALLVAVLACGSEQEPEGTERRAALPPGIVARAGSTDVHVETVRRIAAAAAITSEEARDRAVADALFAEEAATRVPAATLQGLKRAALTRALLEGFAREARARGAPTDAEVETVTRERWVELDRPPSAKVTHAVAMLPRTGDATQARRVADAIREAVRDARTPDEFLRAARAVPAGAVQVRAERLPPITPDGSSFVLESSERQQLQFDRAFAAAANGLSEAAPLSEIVETRFGFHVILLEAKLPELRVPLSDRRSALADEIMSRRAHSMLRELLTKLKQATPVEVARDAEARTAPLGGS